MYVYTTDGVPLPFKDMLAKYPLEKLKSSALANAFQPNAARYPYYL